MSLRFSLEAHHFLFISGSRYIFRRSRAFSQLKLLLIVVRAFVLSVKKRLRIIRRYKPYRCWLCENIYGLNGRNHVLNKNINTALEANVADIISVLIFTGYFTAPRKQENIRQRARFVPYNTFSMVPLKYAPCAVYSSDILKQVAFRLEDSSFPPYYTPM